MKHSIFKTLLLVVSAALLLFFNSDVAFPADRCLILESLAGSFDC